MSNFDKKHWGIFAGGIAFGTAGIRLLTSNDAKRLYANCTAAGLRAKDFVMGVAGRFKENCDDIVAEARQINEDRAPEDAIIEDVAEAAADVVADVAEGIADAVTEA